MDLLPCWWSCVMFIKLVNWLVSWETNNNYSFIWLINSLILYVIWTSCLTFFKSLGNEKCKSNNKVFYVMKMFLYSVLVLQTFPQKMQLNLNYPFIMFLTWKRFWIYGNLINPKLGKNQTFKPFACHWPCNKNPYSFTNIWIIYQSLLIKERNLSFQLWYSL